MPNSLSFNYSYGSALGVWYGCQVLTRITLALHYVGSFGGLIIYTRDVEHGLLFRYIHANGASFFLGFVFYTWAVACTMDLAIKYFCGLVG